MTRRQAEVLAIMWAADEELVYERGTGYVGMSPVGPRTVFALIRMMAISLDSTSTEGNFERYTINETGKDLVEEYWGLR